MKITNDKLDDLYDRIQNLNIPNGYEPRNILELGNIISGLIEEVKRIDGRSAIVAAELKVREAWWREAKEDPHNISTSVMVSLHEVRNAIETPQ